MFSCFDDQRRDCKDIKPLFGFSSHESCDFSFRNDGNPLLQIEVEPTSDVSLLSIPSLPFPFYLEWSVQTRVLKGDIPARISALPIDSALTWESNVFGESVFFLSGQKTRLDGRFSRTGSGHVWSIVRLWNFWSPKARVSCFCAVFMQL